MNHNPEEIEQQIIADIAARRLAQPLWLLHDMAALWLANYPQSTKGLNNLDWWYRLPKKDGKVFGYNLTEASARIVKSVNLVQRSMRATMSANYNERAFRLARDIIVTIINAYPSPNLAIKNSGLRDVIKQYMPPPEYAVTYEIAQGSLAERPANQEKLNDMVAGIADHNHLYAVNEIVPALTDGIQNGHYAVVLPIIMDMAASLIAHDPNWSGILEPRLTEQWRNELVYQSQKDDRLYYRNKECAEIDRRILLIRDWLANSGALHKTGFQIAAYITLSHATTWQSNMLRTLVEAHHYVICAGKSKSDIRKPQEQPREPELEFFEHTPHAQSFSDTFIPTPRPGAKIAWRVLQETRDGHHTNAFRLLVPVAAYLVEAQSRGVHIFIENTSSGMTALDQNYGSKAIYHPSTDLTKEQPHIMRAIEFGMAYAGLWEGVAPEAKAVAVNMMAKLNSSYPFSCIRDIMTAATSYLNTIGTPNEAAWISSILPARPVPSAQPGVFAQLAA